MEEADEVLRFWLDTVGQERWYKQDAALDAEVRDRFADRWDHVRQDRAAGWTARPRFTLALLILLDQFPRNMFRGDKRAFATDRQARAVAKKAIDTGWDRRIDEPARQFFYLPLMHSECLDDQDRAVRLIQERMPQTGADNLLHARAHREVIRRFGRFPERNAAMGRPSTEAEADFLDAGGYPGVVNALRETA